MTYTSKLQETGNPYWKFNVVDPKRSDFVSRAVSEEAPSEKVPMLADYFLKYLKDYDIREPQPTSEYTTEELQEMGFVGVYSFPKTGIKHTDLDYWVDHQEKL